MTKELFDEKEVPLGAVPPARQGATPFEQRRHHTRSLPSVTYRQALSALERQGNALAVASTLVSLAQSQIAAADGRKPELLKARDVHAARGGRVEGGGSPRGCDRGRTAAAADRSGRRVST